MNLNEIKSTYIQKEVPINENFKAVSNVAMFSNYSPELSKGLTYKNWGGYFFDETGVHQFIQNNAVLMTINTNNFLDSNYGSKYLGTAAAFTDGKYPNCNIQTNSAGVQTSTSDYRILILKRFGKSFHSEIFSTITANTELTTTHGIKYRDLSELEVFIRLKCKTAENGYAVGDEVEIRHGLNYSLDSTNMYVYLPSVISLNVRPGGASFDIDFTKWSLYISIVRILMN